jgi:hypothetical protein
MIFIIRFKIKFTETSYLSHLKLIIITILILLCSEHSEQLHLFLCLQLRLSHRFPPSDFDSMSQRFHNRVCVVLSQTAFPPCG